MLRRRATLLLAIGGLTSACHAGEPGAAGVGGTASDGGCAATCAGTCQGGRCLVALVSSESGIQGFAVDATSLYWITFGGDMVATLLKMPLGGGATITLATDQLYMFNGVAVGAASVCWTTSSGAVMRVPLAGGTSTTLATAVQSADAGPGSEWAEAIAVSATSVYWTTGAGELLVMPLTGGSPTSLASGVTTFVLGGSRIYWTTNAGDLLAMAIGGGTQSSLASGVGSYAVDATSVYWTSSVVSCPEDGGACNGGVFKKPLAGGPPTTLASGQDTPVSVAVDSTNVYWMNRGLPAADYTLGGALMTVPVGGGTIVTLSSEPQAQSALGIGEPFGSMLVADATSLYWMSEPPSYELLKLNPK